MICIPFDQCDKNLFNFAINHPPMCFNNHRFMRSAKPGLKVKWNENVLVVAHGNGLTISNFEDEGEMLQPNEFGPRLRAILPENYAGTIWMWSCQAARPWRYIPDLRKQLVEQGTDLEEAAKLSYITLLRTHAGLKSPSQIIGPIGFITNDRRADLAKIYHCEVRKFTGPTIEVPEEGFVHAGWDANQLKERFPAFCIDTVKKFTWADLQDEENDSGSDFEGGNGSDFEGGGDSDFEGGSDSESMEIDDNPVVQHHTPIRQAYRSRTEHINAILANAPFSDNRPPPSFSQRLKKLNKKDKWG